MRMTRCRELLPAVAMSIALGACRASIAPAPASMQRGAELTIRLFAMDDTTRALPMIEAWLLPSGQEDTRKALAHALINDGTHLSLGPVAPGSYTVLVGSLSYHFQHVPLTLRSCPDTLIVFMPRDHSDLGREPPVVGRWRQIFCSPGA